MPSADLLDHGDDDLASLLISALDSDDERRAALILRWTYISLDRDMDADLDRIRESGIPAVVAL